MPKKKRFSRKKFFILDDFTFQIDKLFFLEGVFWVFLNQFP